MSIQSLTPPQDITWRRLAYSRDMIDTNFGDLKFPPKWRSSLAVYYYIVPDENTADAYPNSRIVYLRLTCSITGWNPNEELLNAYETIKSIPASDDLQRSSWETIVSQGWATDYLACNGAILQVAIYPPAGDNSGPDDYPEIMDFEPKKREMFESVTAGDEVLSGSSDKLSITKGNTSTTSVELKEEASVGVPGLASGSASFSIAGTDQNIHNKVTDTSREARETQSHSTTFSQMYQLFNGYHIGTNRAVFVVAPRPHTAASQGLTDFNLIHGQRKLEGIQDVFLIVQLPKKLNGFCVQASVDTGHTFGTPGVTPYSLIVTRRIVQNCGTFDLNGNFNTSGVPSTPDKPNFNTVVWEDLLDGTNQISARLFTGGSFNPTKDDRIALANQLNLNQSKLIKSMISGFSAGSYEPREFTKSQTFLGQVAASIQNLDTPLSTLVQLHYITSDEAAFLTRIKIMKLGDIFKNDQGQSSISNIQNLRSKILAKITNTST